MTLTGRWTSRMTVEVLTFGHGGVIVSWVAGFRAHTGSRLLPIIGLGILYMTIRL